jgi:5'-deoxynucleotidase YfbR-like HD superfamily hydrolase
MVRANGHIRHFYSVAQHSLNCAFEALARGEKDDIALLCLLHDASECYLSDVTRPVKRRLADYRNAEKRLSDVVYASLAGYSPTRAQLQKVAAIDDCLLHHEFKELRGVHCRV